MQPSMQGYVHVEVDDRLRKLLNIIFSDEFMHHKLEIRSYGLRQTSDGQLRQRKYMLSVMG